MLQFRYGHKMAAWPRDTLDTGAEILEILISTEEWSENRGENQEEGQVFV